MAINRWGIWTTFGLLCSFALAPVQADLLTDNFDSQPADAGAPDGYTFFNFTAGSPQLNDLGVSTLLGSVSGSNSAYFLLSFDDPGNGAGTFHGGLDLELSANDQVTVQMRSSFDLGDTGFVALRLSDTDGTVMRTEDADRFALDENFRELSQRVGELTKLDFAGTTPGLDLASITSVGFLFYDLGFTNETTVVVDDLAIIAVVPEPVPWAWIGMTLLLVQSLRAVGRRRFRFLQT